MGGWEEGGCFEGGDVVELGFLNGNERLWGGGGRLA